MTRNKWTKEEIQTLQKCVFESLKVKDGLKKAARCLNSTHSYNGCVWKYYEILRAQKKNYVKPEVNVVEVVKVEKPKSLIEQLQEVAKSSKEIYDAANTLISALTNFKF